MNTKIKSFGFFLLLIVSFKAFSQSEKQPGKQIEKKMLIVLDGKEKIWSNAEFNDSINWSNVKTVKQLPDSIAVKMYKEKAKNGVLVVTTKNSSIGKEKFKK